MNVLNYKTGKMRLLVEVHENKRHAPTHIKLEYLMKIKDSIIDNNVELHGLIVNIVPVPQSKYYYLEFVYKTFSNIRMYDQTMLFIEKLTLLSNIYVYVEGCVLELNNIENINNGNVMYKVKDILLREEYQGNVIIEQRASYECMLNIFSTDGKRDDKFQYVIYTTSKSDDMYDFNVEIDEFRDYNKLFFELFRKIFLDDEIMIQNIHVDKLLLV